MALARIAGFVRLRKVHRRGRPDQGLPGEEEDLTPEWGLPEGERPEVEPPDPDELPSPPGIWPPLEGPDFPLFPVAPEDGVWEPGEIWPPIRPPRPERPGTGLPPHLPPAQPGQPLPPAAGQPLPPGQPGAPGQPLPKHLFFAACRLPEYGWRWVVVDLNAIHRPGVTPPAGGIGGRPPQRPEPGR